MRTHRLANLMDREFSIENSTIIIPGDFARCSITPPCFSSLLFWLKKAFLKPKNLEIHMSKFVKAFTEVFAKNKLFAPVNITLSELPWLQILKN